MSGRFFGKYIIIAVILLGFLLRHYNYLSLPRHGATFDEFAWTWQGINLLQKGVPISWSPHLQYTQRQHLIYQGAAFWIVRPYLEHPPLFGLIAGGFSLVYGAKDMYGVTLHTMRPLALLLGSLSILMVFLLSDLLYGRRVALFSSILYATIPTLVIGSRIVENENFFIPFWLLSLYLAALYVQTKKKKWFWISAIIGGSLILAKVPWVAAGGSLAVIFAFHRKWKEVGIVIGITTLFLLLFIGYGFYYDKDLFISLWRLQLARYDITFVGLYSLFTKPLLVDRYYLDGWIYLGFFSIFLLAQNFKKHIFILLPFISYLAIYIFAIPDEPGHGWYRYPFIPFLVISLGVYLKEYLGKNPFLTFFTFSFVGTTLLQLSWFEKFGFSYWLYRLSIISWLIVFLPLFFPFKRVERWILIWSYIWLAVLIALNVWSITTFIE